MIRLNGSLVLAEQIHQDTGKQRVIIRDDLTGQYIVLGETDTEAENKLLVDVYEAFHHNVPEIIDACVSGQTKAFDDQMAILEEALQDLSTPKPIPVAPAPPPSLIAFAQLMQALLPGAQIEFRRGGSPNAPTNL